MKILDMNNRRAALVLHEMFKRLQKQKVIFKDEECLALGYAVGKLLYLPGEQDDQAGGAGGSDDGDQECLRS